MCGHFATLTYIEKNVLHVRITGSGKPNSCYTRDAVNFFSSISKVILIRTVYVRCTLFSTSQLDPPIFQRYDNPLTDYDDPVTTFRYLDNLWVVFFSDNFQVKCLL